MSGGYWAQSATILVATLSACYAVPACSGPPAGEMRLISFPDAASFAPVGEALHANCGTLDCHGQDGRNLRLYGANGLRLDPAQYPGGGITSPEELAANYRSVISLEPELTALVIQEGGAEPERLTIVTKGRGTNHHKGGEAMVEGEPADRCLVSWLESQVDLEACAAAAEVLRPMLEPAAPTGTPPPAP